MEYKNDRRPIKENDLVSEQPGFFILFVGLIFSVVVGLSIRTAAQSDWFRGRLTEAIANVGTDWRIQHGTVGLYFKDGITPTIGLYANDVKIASESSCYMKSGGFAQRVKIPLSLVKYIIDGQLVSEIEIQDFKIEITERTPVCDRPSVVNGAGAAGVESKKKNQITIVDRVEKSSLRNEIERVRINRLEIFYPDEKYDYFSLKDIVIENRSSHPKILFMEGDLDLAPFVKTAEGKASANLKIEYNEFPEKIIKSNLLGSLREGFFSAQLVNRLEDKKFQLQAELKNVSLSLLQSFVAKVPRDINLKSNWISSKLYIEGLMNHLPSSSVEIKDVLINGDLGEFSVENLSYLKGISGAPNSFELKMKGVNLSKIFSLNLGAAIPDQISSLGQFDGQVDYQSEASIKLNGSVKGLDVVFSAHSTRKTESFQIGKLTGSMVKKRFNFDAQDIKNQRGVVEGNFQLKSDDLKTFDLDGHLKNFALTDATSELLTGVDRPLLFDDLVLKANGGKQNVTYKATGKLKSIQHTYVSLANVAFSVSGNTSKNQEIDVKADSWQNTEMMQKRLADLVLTLPELIIKPKIKLTQVAEDIQLKVESQSSFRMNATLHGDSNLNGTIATKDQEWKVYGTRDNFKIDKK